MSGRPISELQGTREVQRHHDYLAFALVPPDRAELHRRIASRFGEMLDAGLIDEVRGLRARYTLNAAMPSMRCVGYRQVWQFLEGDGDLATLRSRGVAATRQLAKRQFTWLRSTDAELLEGTTTREIAGQIEKRITRAAGGSTGIVQ